VTRQREFVVFDVAAEYAHYRRPYAITTALTFPLPTRTALCGLIGAITGLAKNEGLDDLTDGKALIAVRLLTPVRFGHVSLNLIDTKDNRTFRPKAENPHTIMRYEVIREPRYRVFFAHADLVPILYDLLRQGQSTYTPCCGLAWMIATFEGQPQRQVGVEMGGKGSELVACVTPVRTAALAGNIAWEPEGVYQRLRMPAEMRPDRQVTRHEEYLVETTGRPIRAALSTHWRLEDGTFVSPL